MNNKRLSKLVILVLCGLAVRYAAAEPVKVSTLVWDPYISTNALRRGPASDIVIAAFKHGGYEAQIDHMPWKQAMEKTLEGHYHAIYPAYFSMERMQRFLISDPILCSPVVLIARVGTAITNYNSLDDLRPYRIGVVAGYANAEAFDDATHLNKIVHESDLACLTALKAGTIDLATADKLVAMALIERYSDELGALDEYVFLSPALGNRDMYMMFPKHLPASAARLEGFNQGLKRMQQSGRIEAIIKAYGFR